MIYFDLFWSIFDLFLIYFWSIFNLFLIYFWSIFDLFLIYFWSIFNLFWSLLNILIKSRHNIINFVAAIVLDSKNSDWKSKSNMIQIWLKLITIPKMIQLPKLNVHPSLLWMIQDPTSNCKLIPFPRWIIGLTFFLPTLLLQLPFCVGASHV